jgi:hypothetical protein
MLRKMLLEPFFRDGIGKISDVQLCSHLALLVVSTNAKHIGIDLSKGQCRKRPQK